MILQALLKKAKVEEDELVKKLPFKREEVRRNLRELEREGLVYKTEGYVTVS